ncbi:twin-arginine translocation signal domain-containing protein [Sinirhodobacter populi]|uniref:Twin-arginine translocation signal domain-containing protein n=1 Tax=Paenirhodobacter populi TaxID=2306993 RepID=A0A443K350_9RHOB|nr:twin-arginine translocation signal domain-containing protein [Sinirhodobacter populi]RWR27123.1 twin-arginine translocation signal domain-containing protein [Sinirhodobacter populi]
MSNNQPTRREFLQRVGIGAAAMTVPTVIWSPAHAAEPHFKIYLTIFNNQQTRMIWTDLIGKNIAELGVEVVTSYVPRQKSSAAARMKPAPSIPRAASTCIRSGSTTAP